MNLLAYAQGLELDASAAESMGVRMRSSDTEEARAVAAKLRESVTLLNELAKLVIRYQGLIDRHPTKDADAAALRETLGDLAARLALDVAEYPEIEVPAADTRVIDAIIEASR